MALEMQTQLVSLEILPSHDGGPRRIQYRYRKFVVDTDTGQIIARVSDSPGTFNEPDADQELPITQEAVANMRARQRDKKAKKQGEYKKGTDILADAGVTL